MDIQHLFWHMDVQTAEVYITLTKKKMKKKWKDIKL